MLLLLDLYEKLAIASQRKSQLNKLLVSAVILVELYSLPSNYGQKLGDNIAVDDESYI